MLRNQDRSPSFSLSLLTGWLCRTIRQSLFARRNASAAIFAMVAPASNLRIAAIRSIARITVFANAPGTVPVLPVCQCGTTLAECFRCQFALVGGVPTASVVKITALANAPIDCAIFAVFSGEFPHTLPVYSRERRASPNFSHPVGSIISKKLGQAFSKACRSRAAPWSLHRNGAKSPLPKISSARGSPMPAGIGRRGRIARASPMDEVGSMPTSSIKIEREQHYRLMQSGGTTWAGTALTIIDLFIPWTVRWTVHGGTTSGQNATVAGLPM